MTSDVIIIRFSDPILIDIREKFHLLFLHFASKRISFYRLKFSMTQEKLADLTNCSREYIAYLENGVKTPSLPILVDLANALHISVDALLVDRLDYSLSSSDSDLHRLLLDCNETEQEIIIRTAKELKTTLVSFGI